MSLFIASIVCFILGVLFYFPYLVSSAISLDMVNRGYIKQNARRVRVKSIIEIVVCVLLYPLCCLANYAGGWILLSIIAVVGVVFLIVSGIQRITAMRIFDDGIEDDFVASSNNMPVTAEVSKAFRKTRPSFPHVHLEII